MKKATKATSRSSKVKDRNGNLGVSDVRVSNTLGEGGPYPVGYDRGFVENLENALRLSRKLWEMTLDKRRNIDHECGYPATGELSIEHYRRLYDREGLANRIVGMWPDESWVLNPSVFEDEDPDITTQFETDLDELPKSLEGDSWYQSEEGHPLWEVLNRLDTLSGIGHYGVLLIGIDDGKELEQPADFKPGPKTREAIYFRAFDESMVQIASRVNNVNDRRHGKPEFYNITFELLNDSGKFLNPNPDDETGFQSNNTTRKVHWSRVIHVADFIESSTEFAVPRIRPHLNRIYDARKVLGGSGEMFWRGGLPPIFFVTHPELGTDVQMTAASKTSLEEMFNSLQRYGFIPGVTPMQLAPAVSSPKEQMESIIDAVCIKEGWPKRIFVGSERGELASSQDERAWNKRIKRRQNRYVAPRLIAPTINRLILLGVLTAPEQFFIEFPDLDTLTELEQSQVSLARTQALTTFVQGDGIQLMTELDWWSTIIGLPQDEAQGIVDRAMERMEEVKEEELEEGDIQREKDLEFQKELQDNKPIPPAGGGKPF